MHITIKLFAGLVDRIGSSQIALDLTGEAITASDLKNQLANAYPAAKELIAVSFVAVNQEYAAPEHPITPADEIAMIPPVSGGDGMESADTHTSGDGLYVITGSPLSVDEVTSKVITANHGATLSFVGTTREMTGEQRTVHLEYEAYIPMALSGLQSIGREIESKWAGTRCAISHRIGHVGIAETSVIIAVSSPHRDICYEASRYAIERLKQVVPIWKKEIWEDGSEWKGHQQGPWNPISPL
ncbi:molybdenum cofactor biosynthesis protein MoaE [Paenibacillus sp. YPG26]|uniref:molybdenum cofactor biosynthesis protein n=1 Tax=Paenibacillus sp. YPG26 TaxID=2878915 RepID=UPI00203C8857|nr:molybdenum cofactor biosynthesis protein MoaE [Paenibacillus sp. YPG26]USB32409.1 molybdenum cofactor biosynthesis protein MoaE [Paenibacillus sp. YPG26]